MRKFGASYNDVAKPQIYSIMEEGKIICCDSGRTNDALAYAAMAKNNDPMTMLAAMNGGMGNQWNNPFIYLVWMMFAQRMWGNDWNGGGNLQNAELQNQIQSLRSQIADNQNSNMIMDAIKGNGCAINQLASTLNCDFNTLNGAICDVRQGIALLAGKADSNAEKVINSIVNGNLQMTMALKDCCCQTQQNIIRMGYENQLGQKDIQSSIQSGLEFVNRGVERGFSALGYQNAQDKCDIIRASQDNTQRIIDTLNNHWSDDLRQKYNDARLELSQRDQTTAIVAALKTTATT